MKFNEAMDKLKAGAKVTRTPWRDGVYFLMQGNDVKSFQPKLAHYVYNEHIMVSDGWLVDGVNEELSFCDIIPHLQKGSKARMKDWKDTFIFIEPSLHELAIQSMEVFPFPVNFESFTAEDWVIIE